MNIRRAILKAADHIELNPHLFDFHEAEVPKCGTPGCAIGWIGHFLGAVPGLDIEYAEDFGAVAATTMMELPKGDQLEFYRRMDDLQPDVNWTTSARLCARGLRLYADEYHPAERVDRPGIPDDVRAIFTTQQREPTEI